MRADRSTPAALLSPTEQERRARAKSTEPRIEVGQIWTAPGNDGALGYRRLRILAPHPDGGWITQDVDSVMARRMQERRLGVTPEFNLRYVFELETEAP